MNNKNVCSVLSLWFEQYICGNPHALVPVCEVYLTVLLGTRVYVYSCKRLRPCAVSKISGCGRPQIIHKSMEMAAFSGMSTRVCVFEGIVYVDWKHRIGSDSGRCSKKNIGHRIGRQNWHRLNLKWEHTTVMILMSLPDVCILAN